MESPPTSSPLRQSLGALEYFTFGFGSMVGVGWLVIMDDWLGRGGPGGAMLGFLGGALLLLPIALTYGRLVRAIPDAGAEIAYTERVFPRPASFAAGWMMVLAYAIVCPWEAVAIGNLLARIVPAMNDMVLYSVAGKAITLPRLVAGLVLTALIGVINHRGIRTSGRFQDAMTLGLLACFAVFVVLGASRGNASNVEPLFAAPGPFVSVLLVAQIVPYFMTGFESIPKASEEARPDLGPHTLSRTITVAMIAGGAFYVLVIGVVAWVYPWREIVGQHLGTEAAFARAFGNTWIARLILAGALLSLFKIFNGNLVAATRLLYALGRRGMVHPAIGTIDPRFGTLNRLLRACGRDIETAPLLGQGVDRLHIRANLELTPAERLARVPAESAALLLVSVLTAAAAFLGDALLVPITEVGSAVSGVGWCAACLAFIALARRNGNRQGTTIAAAGVLVSVVIVLMKLIPAVPGSFGKAEWIALGGWGALGLLLQRAKPD